jgi:hypothetical protein
VTKRAQLPDGTILEFPDNTADAVMDKVVRQHLAQNQPQEDRVASVGLNDLAAGRRGPENIPSVLSPEFERVAGGDGFIDRLGYSASQVLPSLFKGDAGVRQRAVEAVPGSRVEKDASGAEIVVTPQGERFYVNKPGLDVDDVLRFGGQVASFLPAGRLVRGGAPILARAGQAGAGAAATDLAGQAASGQGVDPTQTALTGVTGSLGQAGVDLLLKGGTALANTARGLYNKVLAPESRALASQTATITPGAATASVETIPASTKAGEAIGRIAGGGRDSQAALRRGERVARETGINLTPGQLTGGKGTTMAENLARQSIWTRDKMFQGDQTRARQMLNAINRTAKETAGTPASAESFAANLQGQVRNMVNDLSRARSDFGRQAYGAIEKTAGGQKVIPTTRVQDEIAKIVDEHAGVQGADSAAIAAQANKFFDSLKGDGAISAMTALRQLQAWEKAGRTGAGLFEGVQDRSTAKTLALRLSRALSDDIDNAGGNFGDSLRKANAGWRDYSQKIDALEASALGRIVGEDFADDVAGVAFNRVSPEKVWSRLDALAPSELSAVRSYLGKSNPELWQQYQRLTLERARDIARTSAPSQGARTLALDPGAFVKALEGGTGKQAINQQGRLKVIFEGSPLEGQVKSLVEAGRRIADATGTNFSGTAPAAEAMGLLGAAGQGVRAVVGAVAPAVGLRQVAKSAVLPAAQRRLPMLQTPQGPLSLRALFPGVAETTQGQSKKKP